MSSTTPCESFDSFPLPSRALPNIVQQQDLKVFDVLNLRTNVVHTCFGMDENVKMYFADPFWKVTESQQVFMPFITGPAARAKQRMREAAQKQAIDLTNDQ